MSLFLFWILLTRSMYSCFLTLFQECYKQKETHKAEQSFLLSPDFSVEGREGHNNRFMCYFSCYGCCCQVIAHVWMLSSLAAVLCPLMADSATKHPLLEAPIITPVTAKWKMWSGLGHLQPVLLSSSVYTGKHSAKLRRWRGEITWEKWRQSTKDGKSQEWRLLRSRWLARVAWQSHFEEDRCAVTTSAWLDR